VINDDLGLFVDRAMGVAMLMLLQPHETSSIKSSTAFTTVDTEVMDVPFKGE